MASLYDTLGAPVIRWVLYRRPLDGGSQEHICEWKEEPPAESEVMRQCEEPGKYVVRSYGEKSRPGPSHSFTNKPVAKDTGPEISALNSMVSMAHEIIEQNKINSTAWMELAKTQLREMAKLREDMMVLREELAGAKPEWVDVTSSALDTVAEHPEILTLFAQGVGGVLAKVKGRQSLPSGDVSPSSPANSDGTRQPQPKGD